MDTALIVISAVGCLGAIAWMAWCLELDRVVLMTLVLAVACLIASTPDLEL